MGRTLDELEALDRVFDDILDNYDSINSVEDFEKLITEDGIKAINSCSNKQDKEQIDKYTRFLIESIINSIEDDAFEYTYKYSKVLYSINK